MNVYKGPFYMQRVDESQLATVADYHAFVGLECAEGWNLSQLAMAYRLRGKIVAHGLKKEIGQ